jgi:hypothetical protein
MEKTFHDIFRSKEIIEDVSAKVTKEKRNLDEISLEKSVSQAPMTEDSLLFAIQ